MQCFLILFNQFTLLLPIYVSNQKATDYFDNTRTFL